MNILKVTLEYTVVRQVEIITELDMTDAEIEADAYKADTEITADMPAPTILLRKVLKGSNYQVAEIVRESDDFDLEAGKAVINKLIVGKCFRPDGALGTYPKWLSVTIIDRMLVLGLFRQENGGPETMNHTTLFRVGDWESK